MPVSLTVPALFIAVLAPFAGRLVDRFGQIPGTAISAVIFIGAGGALGESSWRAPFVLYAVGIVFAVLVPIVLWQPAARPEGPLVPVDWHRLAAQLAVTLVGGAVFVTPIVELSFTLDEAGVQSTGVIGAIASVFTAIGAALFARVARRGPGVLLPVALGLGGLGLAVMGIGSSVPAIVVGALVVSGGAGLLLPTRLTWAVGTLPYEQRGRAPGCGPAPCSSVSSAARWPSWG